MPLDQFVSGLTRHTILLCVSRQDYAITLRDVLEKAGFEVEVAMSQYDALNRIEVVMPHVLISESVFKDGSVSRLRQVMSESNLVRKVPCIALVTDRSERFLLPLKGFSWQAIMIGPPDLNLVVRNVRACIDPLNGASPFVKKVSDFGISKKTIVRFPADAVGRCGDRILFRSATRIDREAVLICQPVDNKLGTVELHQGVNVRGKNGYFNIFPFSQQRGAGRDWLSKLPELQMDQQHRGTRAHVLWQEEDRSVAAGLAAIFKAYGIDLVAVETNDAALELLKKEAEKYGAVVLKEVNDKAREHRVSVLTQLLPISNRPTVVIQSAFPGAQIDPSIRFLPFPSGLGRLIDAVEAALERPLNYQAFEQDSHTHAVQCNLLLNLDTVAIDEVGGIIFSPYPLEPGSQLQLENAELMELLGGHSDVVVTSCLRDNRYWDQWQIHFARLAGGMSRLKYWQRLLDKMGA